MFSSSNPHAALRQHRPLKGVLASGIALGAAVLSACSGTAATPGESQSPDGHGAPVAPAPPGSTTPSPGQSGNQSSTQPAGTTPVTSTTIAPTSTTPAPLPDPAVDCAAADASESVLRRLSKLEYQFTLKELFQLDTAPNVDAVPQDSDFKGFRTLAQLQSVTTEHLRGYQAVAEQLAEDLLADSNRRRAVVGCELETAGCLDSFIADFGKLAYRRALSAEEVAAFSTLAGSLDETPEQQFVTVVSAMLSAANFLFRVELGDRPEGTELSTLGGAELASRLSFTLLGRGPSKDLLEKGERGELDTAEGLLAETKALLADPRAQEFYDAFFQQWLGFEQLRAPKQPDASWNDSLMLSMQEETQRFLRLYAWTEGANFLDSLTANHSYMRADLAEFYRLPPPAENGYVEFPAGHDREGSGLLSHAALLSAKRDGDRIAHRGAWLQSTFFCIDLQLPTALLDSLSDELAGLTFNEIFERRNTDEACAGCHALIDPIGVGLAAYDEAGRFQSDVDVSSFSVAPGLPQASASFETAGELAALLRNQADVAQCLTRKMFLYTGGREAGSADACTLAQAADRFVNDQYRFASVLEGLVTSPNFRVRRAPAAEAAQGETQP